MKYCALPITQSIPAMIPSGRTASNQNNFAIKEISEDKETRDEEDSLPTFPMRTLLF